MPDWFDLAILCRRWLIFVGGSSPEVGHVGRQEVSFLAVGAWATRFAPDLFKLWDEQLAQLQDDRLGRCLTRLLAGTGPELIFAVVRHVIAEFEVSLDELHNDSTTVSFDGKAGARIMPEAGLWAVLA